MSNIVYLNAKVHAFTELARQRNDAAQRCMAKGDRDTAAAYLQLTSEALAEARQALQQANLKFRYIPKNLPANMIGSSCGGAA